MSRHLSALPSPDFYRLKAATKDLVDRAGGIERAASICGYSKSQVARFACANDPDLISITAARLIEAETGEALVTRAMCALAGLQTEPRPDEKSHLVSTFVAISQHAAALAAETATAIADGVITGRELAALDSEAAQLAQATEQFRGTIAASGGKVVKIGGL